MKKYQGCLPETTTQQQPSKLNKQKHTQQNQSIITLIEKIFNMYTQSPLIFPAPSLPQCYIWAPSNLL